MSAEKPLSFQIVDRVARLLELSVKAIVVALIFKWGFDSLAQFAGRDSSIFLSALLDFPMKETFCTLSISIGISGVVYGRVNAKLRYSKVEDMQGHIKSLEVQLDANRTSSNLTPKGQTNPEDK